MSLRDASDPRSKRGEAREGRRARASLRRSEEPSEEESADTARRRARKREAKSIEEGSAVEGTGERSLYRFEGPKGFSLWGISSAGRARALQSTVVDLKGQQVLRKRKREQNREERIGDSRRSAGSIGSSPIFSRVRADSSVG